MWEESEGRVGVNTIKIHFVKFSRINKILYFKSMHEFKAVVTTCTHETYISSGQTNSQHGWGK